MVLPYTKILIVIFFVLCWSVCVMFFDLDLFFFCWLIIYNLWSRLLSTRRSFRGSECIKLGDITTCMLSRCTARLLMMTRLRSPSKIWTTKSAENASIAQQQHENQSSTQNDYGNQCGSNCVLLQAGVLFLRGSHIVF